MHPDDALVFLFEILVPTTRRKDGKPIRTRQHRVWDAKVRAIAGGLTILQPVKGQWLATDAQLHQERMIPVRIACTYKQVGEIAAMTASFYDQLAVMFYRVADCVEIRRFG